MSETVQRVAALAREIRSKGIKLWVDNGDLHYQAPKGVLSEGDIALLRSSKRELVTWLSRVEINNTSAVQEIATNITARSNRFPVAYSQQAHWNVYRLHERPSIRQIASALCLRGRLDTDALRGSLREITRRHQTLRMKISTCGGGPVQEISRPNESHIRIEDMTRLPATRIRVEAVALIKKYLLEPVCVRTDPLFGVLLLKVADTEHLLVLAMEHLISDAFSMNLVLQELLTAYAQIVAQQSVTLPTIAVQFPDFAAWQRSEQRVEIEKRATEWQEQLSRCSYERFCPDHVLLEERSPGLGTVPIQITPKLKSALGEWCRVNKTTLVMSAFTAYIALVIRWCRTSETIVQYMTDGRDQPELENTVGYLATPIYLRTRLNEGDTFTDLLRTVKEEFCMAYEHADCWYLEAQSERPPFAHCGVFNWVPQGQNYDRFALKRDGLRLEVSPVQFGEPTLRKISRDNDPSIALFETDAAVTGGVYFPLRKFSVEAMARFGSAYVVFLHALADGQPVRIQDIPLPK